MKNIYIPLLFLMMYTYVKAQQKPIYTQYILNQYIINPALTGIENYTDIKLSHRHQWVGIEDAPVTTYFTIQAPIGKKDFRTTSTTMFDMEGENPRGKSYWDDYTAARSHHGIGLQVIDDRTGPLNHFNAYVTYAYHIGISPTTNLAAGFGAGISDLSVTTSKLQFDIPVDPAVYGSGILNKVTADFMAGLYLYSGDYFVGVSALQISPQKLDYSNNAIKTQDTKLVPHFFATAGYRFLAGDNFNITPSVMLKYVDPVPLQFDVNTKIQYRDFAWAGVGYRNKDGISAMAGMNVAKAITVSYSYDYTTSKLNNYTRGTHEILVGFIIGNKYGDSCPRNVW